MTTELEMYRGDDRSFTITITADGSPLDLTGASVRFTAKRRITDDDSAAVVRVNTTDGGVVVTNAMAGQVRVDISGAATALLAGPLRLVWDIQITDANGKVRTVPEPDPGVLVVRADITRGRE